MQSAFLVIEKAVRQIKGGHGHGHSHGAAPSTGKKDAIDKVTKQEKTGADAKEQKSATAPAADMKVTAYLNLAADAAHNFTDGLAIGASFLVDERLAWITVFTILLHEVPHEIGDFAILVQAGCSKQKVREAGCGCANACRMPAQQRDPTPNLTHCPCRYSPRPSVACMPPGDDAATDHSNWRHAGHGVRPAQPDLDGCGTYWHLDSQSLLLQTCACGGRLPFRADGDWFLAQDSPYYPGCSLHL